MSTLEDNKVVLDSDWESVSLALVFNTPKIWDVVDACAQHGSGIWEKHAMAY